MSIQRQVLMLSLLVSCLFSTSPLSAAPITFNTALAVSKGEFIFRQQWVQIQSQETTSLNRDRQQNDSVSALVYGVTSDWTVFVILPYTQRTLTINNGVKRQSSGFSDSQVIVRYTLFQKDSKSTSFRVAPFFGIKIPSGKAHISDTIAELPQNLQLSSGSWDRFSGVVATYATTDWELDGQVAYKSNGTADQLTKGDTLSGDLSLQFRILPKKLSNSTNYFFNAVIEMKYVSQSYNRIDSFPNRNSGGHQVFAVIGLQYITQKFIVESSLQRPIQQNLNGMALENESVIRTGFRINF